MHVFYFKLRRLVTLKAFIVFVCLLFAAFSLAPPAYAQGAPLICINDDFSGSQADFDMLWQTARSQGNFTPQMVNGRMRLTQSVGNQATLASILRSYPAANNLIIIEFDYFTYSPGGLGYADGVTVVFSDATVQPIAGGDGGALGYSSRNDPGRGFQPGFQGGWLGIALDSYGNFGRASDGQKTGGFNESTSLQQARNRLALRASQATGYAWLGQTNQLNPGFHGANNHRYRIQIDSRSNNVSLLRIERRLPGQNWQVIVGSYTIPNSNTIPENLIVSFTGSTGGGFNVHEFGGVQVCAINFNQVVPEINHFRLYHPQTAMSCDSAPLQLEACLDESCNNRFTSPVDFQLIANGGASWSGADIQSSSSTSVTATMRDAESNLRVAKANGGTLALSLGEVSIDVTGNPPLRCYAAGTNQPTNCNIEFNTAGLSISGSATSPNTPIASSVAGDNFTSYLWAVQNDPVNQGCIPLLAGEQTVDFALECRNPSSCSASSAATYQINGAAIAKNSHSQVVQYQPANVTFNTNGRATLGNNYQDVGSIRLHARIERPAQTNPLRPEVALETISGVSTTDFVIRPHTLQLTALDSAGNSVTATTNSGAGYKAAGEPFAVQIEARMANGNITPNFGRENNGTQVGVNFTNVVYPQTNATLGNWAGGLNNVSYTTQGAPAGTIRGENLTWHNVGTIEITPTLPSGYLGAGNALQTVPGQAGRFYPARLSLQTQNLVANTCSSFTYMQQPGIGLQYQLHAESTNGSITTNYHQEFAPRASVQAAPLPNNSSGLTPQELNLRFGAQLSSSSTNAVPVLNNEWDSGVLNVNRNDILFARAADSARLAGMPDGPFNNINVGIELAGGLDPVALVNAQNTSVPESVLALTGDLHLRYGRMVLDNIYGPELEPLPVRMRTEYWRSDWNRFVHNAQDQCTALNVADMISPQQLLNQLSIPVDPSLPVPERGGSEGNMASGFARSFELYWQLPAGQEIQLEVPYSHTAPPWLTFDWIDADGTAFPEPQPRAWATFGRFRGSDRVGYWLENR